MSGWRNCPNCGCMIAHTERRCPVCRAPRAKSAAAVAILPRTATVQLSLQIDDLSGYELVEAVETALNAGKITVNQARAAFGLPPR